nr:hypothetical protein CFP56_74586 [Quercus suber]
MLFGSAGEINLISSIMLNESNLGRLSHSECSSGATLETSIPATTAFHLETRSLDYDSLALADGTRDNNII